MRAIISLLMAGLLAFLAYKPAAVSAADPSPQPRHTIEGGGGALMFSPDSKWLAGTTRGRRTWRQAQLRIWNVADGKEVHRFADHDGGIWRVSFSPDGKRIATNDNWHVRVWNIADQRELFIRQTPAFTRTVVFSPDGQRVAGGGDDGTISLWDAESGQPRLRLRRHGDWVPGIAFSPDGKHLASGSVDLTVRIWDLEQAKTIMTLRGHEWYVGDVAYRSDGKQLISASDDMTARVWDVETGEELQRLEGHTDWVSRAMYGPDDKWIVTAGRDRTVRFWDPNSAEEVVRLDIKGDLRGIAISPDGRWLALSIKDEMAFIYAIESILATTAASTPRLPDELFDYASSVPKYIDSESLAATDNTPADNPTTNAGATLGRVLFYDERLSRNTTIACASCHLQQRAFADPRRFSVGFEGGKTGRNAMSLANLRYSNIQGHRPGFFWDERAVTLEAQALMPIQDHVEMGLTLEQLEQRVSQTDYYPPLFNAAFGSPEVTHDRIAKAIAQFMRALTSFDSKYDRAAAAYSDPSEPFADFTDDENHGKSLFFNGADGIAEHGCAHCHVPPTFSMTKAMNNGLTLRYDDAGLGKLDRPPNDPFTPSNDGKFKAPSLRNIALTAPYMHDGRFQTLQQVMTHYSIGVYQHENLAIAVEAEEPGFRFTGPQQHALIAFLKTLTDDSFITDPRFSDPFPAPSTP